MDLDEVAHELVEVIFQVDLVGVAEELVDGELGLLESNVVGLIVLGVELSADELGARVVVVRLPELGDPDVMVGRLPGHQVPLQVGHHDLENVVGLVVLHVHELRDGAQVELLGVVTVVAGPHVTSFGLDTQVELVLVHLGVDGQVLVEPVATVAEGADVDIASIDLDLPDHGHAFDLAEGERVDGVGAVLGSFLAPEGADEEDQTQQDGAEQGGHGEPPGNRYVDCPKK